MSEIQKQSELKLVSIGNDAQYINQQIELGNQAFGKSLEHYRNAGERLSKVRDRIATTGQRVKGVGFKPWVEQNCKIQFKQVYKYISLYESWNELVSVLEDTNEIFTLVDALKAIKDIKSKSLESDDEYADATAIRIEEANVNIETKTEKINSKLKEIEKLKKDAELEAKEIRFRAEQVAKEKEEKAEMKSEEAEKLYNETIEKAVHTIIITSLVKY